MKNNYLAPQISYEYQLKKMGSEDLVKEYNQILDKGSLSEDDKQHLILINKTYYQLNGKYLYQL
jgi:hypothetical protein